MDVGTVIFLLGITYLALYRNEMILKVAALVALILSGLSILETSYTFGVPVFILALYMTFKIFTHYISRR